MAAASATLSSAIWNAVTVNITGSKTSKSKVQCMTGLNSLYGLKARNCVTTIGFPAHANVAFAKGVSSLQSPSKSNGRGGGPVMSVAGEIFRIAATINGLVLIGVAVGFVLLRVEQSFEEAD